MRTQKKEDKDKDKNKDNNKKDGKRRELQAQPQQRQPRRQQQPLQQSQPQSQSQQQPQPQSQLKRLKPRPKPKKPGREPRPRKNPFKPAYVVDLLPSDVVRGIEVEPRGDHPIFLLAFIFFYLLYTPMDYFSEIDPSLGTVLGIASVITFAILINLGEVKVSGTYFQPATLFSFVFSVITTGLYALSNPSGALIYFLISLFFAYICVRPYGKTVIYAEPFWIPLPFIGLTIFEKYTPLIVSVPYITFFLLDVFHARRSRNIVVGGAGERDALFHVPGGICAIANAIVLYYYFMKLDLSYDAREVKSSLLLLAHGVLDGIVHIVRTLVREIVERVSEIPRLLTSLQPR